MGSKISSRNKVKKTKSKRTNDKFDKAMDDVKRIGMLSCFLVAILLVVSLFVDPKESYAAVVEELPDSFISRKNPTDASGGIGSFANYITEGDHNVTTPKEFYGEAGGSRLSNIYCMDRKLLMDGGVTYNKDKSVVDASLDVKYPGLIYIIENGDSLPDNILNTVPSNEQAYLTYYLNQLAVWWYIDIVNGYTPDANSVGSNYKNGVITEDEEGSLYEYDNNLSVLDKQAIINDTKYGPYVRDLVTKATSYQANTNPTLNAIDINSITFTMTESYIETDYISVTSNSSNFVNYTVNTNNTNIKAYNEAGVEKTTFNANERFKLRIPLSAIVDYKINLNVSIIGNFSVHDAYFYVANGESTDSLRHQRALLGQILNTTKSVEAPLEYEIPTGKVIISKQDSETGLGLKGAVLSITDKTGKEVYRYETTGEDLELTLPVGSYMVTETVIPEGYQAEVTTINFDVISGATTPVVIKNTPTINVPDTSLNSNLVYGVGSLIIIVGIILIVVAVKPRNAKKKK